MLKSVQTWVLPVKGKRTMKLVTEEHRKWNHQSIASLEFEKLAKYLGVKIQQDGNILLQRKKRELHIDQLKRSHLTSLQKVQAIRKTICGRIVYQLWFSDHWLEVARILDRMIRKAVKEILHISTWVWTEWIHHRHGANIPNLMRNAMLCRKKLSEQMKKSDDPIVRTVGNSIDPFYGERLEKLEKNSSNKRKVKDEEWKKSEERIEKQSNGKEIIAMFKRKVTQSWMWTDTGLTPNGKLRCI